MTSPLTLIVNAAGDPNKSPVTRYYYNDGHDEEHREEGTWDSGHFTNRGFIKRMVIYNTSESCSACAAEGRPTSNQDQQEPQYTQKIVNLGIIESIKTHKFCQRHASAESSFPLQSVVELSGTPRIVNHGLIPSLVANGAPSHRSRPHHSRPPRARPPPPAPLPLPLPQPQPQPRPQPRVEVQPEDRARSPSPVTILPSHPSASIY